MWDAIHAAWARIEARDFAGAGAIARPLVEGAEFVSDQERMFLGRLLHSCGAYGEALDVYSHCRGMPLALDVMIAAESAMRLGDPALASRWLRLLALHDPAAPPMLRGVGVMALTMGERSRAGAWFRRALAVAAADPSALTNLGNVLQIEGRHREAIRTLRRAVRSDPGRPGPLKNLANALYYAADVPLAAFDEVHRAWYRACKPPHPIGVTSSSAPSAVKSSSSRIRLAVISSDLRDHPVGRNLWPILSNLDRDRFEILLFDQNPVEDAFHARFLALADHHQVTASMADPLAARVIQDAGADIALFTAGHFDDNRPMLAAWRVAPVQISYLDAGRLHCPEMDYLLIGRGFAPRDLKEPGCERILHLPRFYQHEPLPEMPIAAPPDIFTFGAFCNPAKLNSAVLAAWRRILITAPEARIRFRYRSDYAEPAIQARIRAHFGGAADRLDFEAGLVPMRDHLSTVGATHLALDPFPFPGSTATFTAAWMGVPTLTLAGGTTIMSHYGAGIARQFGDDHLIASDVDDYIERAVAWAAAPAIDLAGRRARRARVRATACRSNARPFGRWLGLLWRKHCRAAAMQEAA